MRPLILLCAAAVTLTGCASSGPVSIGPNRYELATLEGKSTAYPRLQRFCAERGLVFNERYAGRDGYEFECKDPRPPAVPTQRLELDIR